MLSNGWFFLLIVDLYEQEAKMSSSCLVTGENYQNSNEKRFEDHLKTLWKPYLNLLLCTEDPLGTKPKRFIGVSAPQKNLIISYEKRSQDHLETLWKPCWILARFFAHPKDVLGTFYRGFNTSKNTSKTRFWRF